MQVGSLIFVVIVAIWAAYLLQHWVRRREDAAATRSVEGFSKAMRVLEKRPLLPQTELRAPRPNSYAVKPAAASRATVDVKRAVPAGAARPSSPLVARRASDRLDDRREIDQQHPSDAHRGEVDRMPVSHSPSRRDRAHQGRPSRPHRVSMAQRRLRAALLLLALLWLPVSIVLAITGVLLWVSVPFAFVTLVAVLYWLRTEAQADRAHRADHRADQRADRGSDRRRPGGAPAPVLSSEATQVISHRAIEEARRAADRARHQQGRPQQVAHAGPVQEPAVAAAAAATAYDGVFDVQAAQTGGVHVQPAAAPAAAEEVPGSWSPVPVPVPTYALKAKAEPRYTDDGIPADVFDTPEFADEAEELDDRALFARRAVSG
ncbi:hypothetical protein [Humibacillus xanthopallidus]|uniref:hypothetical protein n=1 Tax=Humibacillus xanthopallidus TaxID=412689 RepID=UPI001151284F|nr:hypothetical protein [Humibacillus xanthopallidus]